MAFPTKRRAPSGGTKHRSDKASANRKVAPKKGLEVSEWDGDGQAFPSVGAWMRQGIRNLDAESQVKTATDAGRLRGGSVGCVISESAYTGTCQRAALARFMGSEPPRDMAKWVDTHLMLDGGKAAEEAFVEPLLAGLPQGFTIRREDEWPIRWQVGSVAATGREDVIIFDAQDKPVCLVELKNLSSLATEVLFAEYAKLENAIQLANYMLRTGLPGQLWYTSRVIHSLPSWPWVTSLLPSHPGDDIPGASAVEWSKGGAPTKLRPFMIGFHLAWKGDQLYYSRASNDDAAHAPTMWAKTPITKQGIDQWYEGVIRQQTDRQLASPPTPHDIDGTKKTYKACDYCDWRNVCASAGTDYASWSEAVTALRAQPKAKTK